MNRLTEEQLHNLSKNALVILFDCLQDQLASMQEQLEGCQCTSFR